MRTDRKSYIYLLLFFLVSCSNNEQKEAIVSVRWELISISTDPLPQSHISVSIENNLDIGLSHNNFKLHYNQIGGVVQGSSVPPELKITNLIGDYFEILPTDQFNTILPGQEWKFEYTINGHVDKMSEVPVGMFIVVDGIPENVKLSIAGLNEDRLKAINPTTAISRFQEDENLHLLSSEQLYPIIPAPNSYTLLSEEKILGQVISYAASEGLENEIAQLKEGFKRLGHELIEKAGEADITLALNKQENTEGTYRLRIDKSGINITSSSESGIFYAIQSLLQLRYYAESTDNEQFVLEGIDISDMPRFTYRGMHIDVSRNFHSKNKILKLLDLLAFFKVNKFHFHITDDEGWRLEIPGLPELTDIGSKRGYTLDERDHLVPSYGSGFDPQTSYGSGYYSRQDFIDILKYANHRHIEVITEIDMPGHARAAIKSMEARYESHLIKGDTAAALEYRLHDPDDESIYASAQNWPDNVVCICQQGAFNFMEKVFSELIAMYKEADAPITAIHVGGDEQPYGAWQKSPLCAQFIKENRLQSYADLPGYFFKKMTDLLSGYGLSTAGWEEMAIAHTSEGHESTEIDRALLNEDLRLYVWNAIIGGGRDDMIYKLANAGFPVIMSNSASYYFDMAYDRDPDEIGLSWSGFSNTKKIFATEPLNIYQLRPLDINGRKLSEQYIAERTRITDKGLRNFLGIQSQLWSETVRKESAVDYLVFPKLLAFSQKAWSPAPGWTKSSDLDDIEDLFLNDWNLFANTIGQKALTMLEEWEDGVKFRIPEPGVKIENGILFANTAFPGLTIKYHIGSDTDDLRYHDPIQLTTGSIITLWCETSQGRKGRSVVLQY